MTRICLHCQENETPDGDNLICDPCFDNAVEYVERNVRLLQALPHLLEKLESLVELAESVAANWENGNLAASVASLSRSVQEAKTVIADAKAH